MKFKITIQRAIKEEYVMTIEKDSIMAALDDARYAIDMANASVNNNDNDQLFVTKIESK
ncbi:MAG TPA: hypothetical protein VII94_00335 [Candidatus Saccharimonadales bacterium]